MPRSKPWGDPATDKERQGLKIWKAADSMDIHWLLKIYKILGVKDRKAKRIATREMMRQQDIKGIF